MTRYEYEHQKEVIDEITLVARAVKKHLAEDNCKHTIKEIVAEALKNK